MFKIIKKTSQLEDYNFNKIKRAIDKSAERVGVKITENQYRKLEDYVISELTKLGIDEIPVSKMHTIVECGLDTINLKISKSYRDYRNYKKEYAEVLDGIFQASKSIRYLADKDNANTDSTLVSTQRSLLLKKLTKELYRKFELTQDERNDIDDGYYYIHDIGDRSFTMNCFDKETRFITSDGVRSFTDYKDGDKILVPTHTGQWKSAVVHYYGNQEMQEVIFKRGTGEKKIICTKNHRWILKDGSETTELKVKNKLFLTPNISKVNLNSATREQKLLWAYGFAMADGSSYQNHCAVKSVYTTIMLFGEKSKYVPIFEQAGLNVTYIRIKKYDTDIPCVYVPFFDKKEYDPRTLSIENKKFYTYGFLCADGNRIKKKNGCSEFRGVQVTGEKENEIISTILPISGYYITSEHNYTGQKTNFGVRTKKTISYHTFTDSGCRGYVVKTIKPLNEIREAWCLEVEDDHSFILDGGIVTGNCCLFDIGNVMRDGFDMANMHYNEPSNVRSAMAVMSDIALSAAAQQYGRLSY